MEETVGFIEEMEKDDAWLKAHLEVCESLCP